MFKKLLENNKSFFSIILSLLDILEIREVREVFFGGNILGEKG